MDKPDKNENLCVVKLSFPEETNQLREHEKYQIVVRKEYPQIPPRVEYSLSAIGESFLPALDTLSKWGATYCGKIEQELNSN